ncbi:hypothetical protein CGLO_03469 [Colletotrichum gloeosporioides Cg-14]|uniref:Uncharacterized protein n=1 Tax=Colletotrichum gloeosporioides (strain Cg-14) TaxID=1237896 RepID=T0LY93_COLGC|nr:hypothetical protein CGLO_03469 [Colletotrichum gloeosporioides Cg-14]
MSTLPHMPNLRALFLNLPKRNNKWVWLGDFYELLDSIKTLRHVVLGKGFDEQLGQALLDNVLCSAELACGCPGVGKANNDLDYKFPLTKKELRYLDRWTTMVVLGCHVIDIGRTTDWLHDRGSIAKAGEKRVSKRHARRYQCVFSWQDEAGKRVE